MGEDRETILSVVIPARDATASLAATLRGLAEQDIEEPFEVIVVDNGSSDRTAELAEEDPLPVKVIRRAPGDGPGVARNEGAAAATGRWIAFTDADCVPTAGWLRQGLASLARAELVQGAVLPDPSSVLMPFDHTVWVRRRSGLFETANLFVSKQAFERVGGFQDISETASERPFGEDAWFGWRLVRAGVSFEFSEQALVHHEVFRRGSGAFVGERRRQTRFPALIARIPELRRDRLFCRLFLTRRTAAFDLGLAGLVAAFVSGLWPMALAALPYLVMLGRGAVGWRRWAPVVLATHLAADIVSFVSLLYGSVRHRSFVL
jgi:glycosyltransferase involved in cell wall biosynthesis